MGFISVVSLFDLCHLCNAHAQTRDFCKKYNAVLLKLGHFIGKHCRGVLQQATISLPHPQDLYV